MAFWRRNKDPLAALRDRIGSYELPTFSTSAISTLSLLRADGEMSEIAEGILADPGLTIRILRTVNSAGFGLRQEVTNLVTAASLLGRSRLESLVLTAAVRDSLPTPPGLDLAGFWRTSAHRACLARGIAAAVDPAREVEAFTAGLLQDMAVPVLVSADPERYGEIYRRAGTEQEAALHEIEKNTLGYDHAEIGALMAESWSLPEGLIQAIAGHHDVDPSEAGPVGAVGRVKHSDPQDDLSSLRSHCEDHLGLTSSDLDGLIDAASTESASLADSMTRPARV